jgi:uncharacterized NAD(P)/FAD-binding protein YdhS
LANATRHVFRFGTQITGERARNMDAEDSCASRSSEIAIVGGGASGALVAAQLVRQGFSGRIALLEMRARLGHGLAYSTSLEQHLLNVPAGKMSAFPDQPAHFLEWLRARNAPGAAADAFAPRRLYGEYIEDVLKTSVGALGGGKFCHIRAEVVDARVTADGATLALDSGATVKAAKVVLALGNSASAPFEHPSVLKMGSRWHVSPWMGDALRVRFAGERILLVGTGLTAVDSALALNGQALAAKTFMISRRGILPYVHDLRRQADSPPVFADPSNIRLIFRELRARIEHVREADGCWRPVVDSLRPVSNEIWQGLPLEDRSRFVRHLKTYWEAHRHRMAPQVQVQVDKLRAQDKLEVIAGRIRESVRKGDAIDVAIVERRGAQRRLEVDRAINCTGIHEDYNKSPRRLIRALVESGLARANDLGSGFRTDLDGALIDRGGKASPVLFTLGPPRRGELFETTAIPEIRSQAEALARHLMAQMAIGQAQ